MNAESQSSSATLGQNLTPSRIISHPGSEEKKFYVSLNSTNRSTNNQISIVEHNKQQQNLSHNSIPFEQYIKDILFREDHSLIVHSLNISGTSHLSLLKPQSISPNKGQFQSIQFNFQEDLKNIMSSKNGLFAQGQKQLFQFDIEKNIKSEIFHFQQSIDLAAVDIIHDNLILCASNQKRQIQVIDQQTKGQKYTIQNINNSDIVGIHFNPIKQYNFMSVFQDCFKVWDMRKTNLPIKCNDNHHSLLLDGKYNSTYDQLILTSYDDGTLGLFRMSSGTSVINKMSNNPTKQEEGLVKLYDEHQDSAYCISWASFTPWMFASVSYNGNLIINEIPSALKVRILF